MTGAGSLDGPAFALEDDYGVLPDTPDWYQPGGDIEVGSASLNNALTRARHPDDARPATSRPGNLEGALSVTHTMTDTNFHDLIFADSGTGLIDFGEAPTATWYLGQHTLPDIEERFATGGATESVTINWQQGEDVTVEQTIIYGTEKDLTTPSSITQPSLADTAAFHSGSLEIDATTVSLLQSYTLEISGLARFQRGQQREPVNAVVGAYEPSLNVEAVLEDGTQRELSYGSTSATEPLDEIDTSPATATLANAQGTVAEYNLSGLQPDSYDWSNLAAPEDTTEPTMFHVTDVQVA